MDIENRIINGLTVAQRYIILLFVSNNYEPIRGKLWYQKEMFLLANNFDNLEQSTDFKPDFMGPYSEIAESELEELELCDVIDIDNYRLKLTEMGQEIGKVLVGGVDIKQKEIISNIKSFLNDLTQDELLGFIYFSFPEMRKESIKFERIKAKRKNIADDLYKKGKVSISKAAEIAGIDIEKYIYELKSKGVSIYTY